MNRKGTSLRLLAFEALEHRRLLECSPFDLSGVGPIDVSSDVYYRDGQSLLDVTYGEYVFEFDYLGPLEDPSDVPPVVLFADRLFGVGRGTGTPPMLIGGTRYQITANPAERDPNWFAWDGSKGLVALRSNPPGLVDNVNVQATVCPDVHVAFAGYNDDRFDSVPGIHIISGLFVPTPDVVLPPSRTDEWDPTVIPDGVSYGVFWSPTDSFDPSTAQKILTLPIERRQPGPFEANPDFPSEFLTTFPRISIPANQLGTAPPDARFLLVVADPDRDLTEWSEDNNLASVPLIPFDMSAESLSWTSTSQDIEFEYEITWDGSSQLLPYIPSTNVSFYWATNTTRSSIVGGPFSTQSLQSTVGQFELSVPPSAAPTDANFVIAIIESHGFENDQSNNTIAVAIPDTTSDIVAVAANWVQGGIEFAYEIRDADLPQNTNASFYWSIDDSLDVASVISGPFYNATLDRLQGSYGPLFVPVGGQAIPDPPNGATHLILALDPPADLLDPTGTDQIDEPNESNNLRALKLPPDIRADSISIDDGNVSFSWEILGSSTPVDPTVALYWSDNVTFESGNDTLAVASDVTRLVGSYNASLAISDLTSTSKAPASSTHLLLVVDPPTLTSPNGAIDEREESNNEAAIALTDIAIIDAVTYDTQFRNLQILYTVLNADAPPFIFRAYLSKDDSFEHPRLGPGGDREIGEVSAELRSMNAPYILDWELDENPISSAKVDGSKFIIIVADPDGHTLDTDTSNNTSFVIPLLSDGEMMNRVGNWGTNVGQKSLNASGPFTEVLPENSPLLRRLDTEFPRDPGPWPSALPNFGFPCGPAQSAPNGCGNANELPLPGQPSESLEDRLGQLTLRAPLAALVRLVRQDHVLQNGFFGINEAYDTTNAHEAESLHYDGRAIDLDWGDRSFNGDQDTLGRFAGLAWLAGFDWVFFEHTHVHVSVVAAGPASQGDFNANGVTDGNDVQTWELNFGANGGAFMRDGDADGDGSVTGHDFLVLQRGFGKHEAIESPLIESTPLRADLVDAAIAYSLLDDEPPRSLSGLQRAGNNIDFETHSALRDKDFVVWSFVPTNRTAWTRAVDTLLTDYALSEGQHFPFLVEDADISIRGQLRQAYAAPLRIPMQGG